MAAAATFTLTGASRGVAAGCRRLRGGEAEAQSFCAAALGAGLRLAATRRCVCTHRSQSNRPATMSQTSKILPNLFRTPKMAIADCPCECAAPVAAFLTAEPGGRMLRARLGPHVADVREFVFDKVSLMCAKMELHRVLMLWGHIICFEGASSVAEVCFST